MKKNSVVFMLMMSVTLGGVSVLHADEGFASWLFSVERKKGVEPVTDAIYNEECSACHFPYQPGWLPEASWQKLIAASALEDHFGESAELDEQTQQHIINFLTANSADKSYYKRSKKIMASLNKDQAPIRITKVPYIIKKHDEIPEKLISKNEKVKSLSYCEKCHKKAEKGIFDDDSVFIPGHGYWSD
ncbi:MAG: cytochrome C [Gammaproteobacteria bacterium]|nr:cytochrome C [Gammaproteobacteria bacterium]